MHLELCNSYVKLIINVFLPTSICLYYGHETLMPKLFNTLIFYLHSSLLHKVAEFGIKRGGSNQIDIAF